MADAAQLTDKILYSAARVAFRDDPTKQDLVYYLLRQHGYSCDLHDASAACGIPHRSLAQLARDACFKTAGECIYLSPEGLKAMAKQNTSTGVLLNELPKPVAYVDGVYPIRPGRMAGGCTAVGSNKGGSCVPQMMACLARRCTFCAT